MSSKPSSNMISKMFCPKCKSFNLKRLHRGYIKKTILKQPAQYKCLECKEQLSELVIANNESRKVPIFIAK